MSVVLAGAVNALTAAPAHAQADTTPPTLGATAGGVTTFGRVIGTDIHLYFSEAIDQDSGNLPVPDGFFIKVDGVSWSIRPGSVRGGADKNELVLGDLSAPIFRGQTVSVAYADPGPGDDAAAIQDLAGNDAEAFDFATIDNGDESTAGLRPAIAEVSNLSACTTVYPAAEPGLPRRIEPLWVCGFGAISYVGRIPLH